MRGRGQLLLDERRPRFLQAVTARVHVDERRRGRRHHLLHLRIRVLLALRVLVPRLRRVNVCWYVFLSVRMRVRVRVRGGVLVVLVVLVLLGLLWVLLWVCWRHVLAILRMRRDVLLHLLVIHVRLGVLVLLLVRVGLGRGLGRRRGGDTPELGALHRNRVRRRLRWVRRGRHRPAVGIKMLL